MILLPDIEFMIDGQIHVLSIHDPYLLNGYLITDINVVSIEFAYRTTPLQRICMRNENDDWVEIRSDEIEHLFRRTMNDFMSRYGSNAHVEGRRDITDWGHYDVTQYIYEIQEQCARIQEDHRYSGSNYYLEILKRDLRRQGREYHEPARLHHRIDNIIDWCNSSVVDRFASLSAHTPITNATINADSFRESLYDWAIHGISLSDASRVVCNMNTQNRKYIHDYNYKPTYIRNYMPNEDKDTTLIMGCEIEVAGNDNEPNREDVVKKCIQIINGSEDDAEDLIYSTSDSTVQIELDTMPCSLEFHKNRMNYKELFKYLDELGYKGHDCDCAGLHIHADRKYLGKSELVQQLTISKILYILEKFNDEICVIARRNNSYSKFVGKEEVNKSLDKLYGKYKNEGKRVALNLQHDATIEFRMFKSTLKYETLLLTLEFVKDIIDYAKSINIEQIELIKWSDLMNTFSDELRAYYNERLEIESKKKEENHNEKLTDGVYIANRDGLTISAENIVTANPYLYGLNSNYRFYDNAVVTVNPNALRDFMFGGVTTATTNLGDCSYYVSIDLNHQTIEKTIIETLKDKEKMLKKKIKYSNNPMEKKSLEKELKETQKELKKEKKKNKLNNNTNITNEN